MSEILDTLCFVRIYGRIDVCMRKITTFVGMRAQHNKPLIGENLLYFMVWSLVLLVPILNSKMMAEEHVQWGNILTAWSKVLPYIVIFIFNNFIFAPQLLMRRRYIYYLGVLIVVLTAMFLGLDYYQLNIQTTPDDAALIMHGKASFTDLQWYWNVLLGLFLCGANSLIKMMFLAMREEQRVADLERHRLQTEMVYLKYQINPHFFMNTLNNIHALIDIDQTAAQKSVLELSKMMRYVLYESDNATINVIEEVRFIKNYIALMKIRYTDDVDVRLEVQDPMPSNIKIPPLLLIVLVENAFKHGVSYNKASFVHISIECTSSEVICKVDNSRHNKQHTDKKNSGVGLDNMQKRLDLLFGDKYQLLINSKNPEIYSVTLKMPINNDEMYSNR